VALAISGARRVTRRAGLLGIELVVPAGLVAGWWIASSGSTSIYFPPLSKILSAFRQIWVFSHFRSDLIPSHEYLAAGLLLATVVGVAVGLTLGLTPVIADALTPVLEFLRAMPAVALVPAALLLLGIGPRTQIIVIASAAVWPILLNTIDGTRGIDPMVLDVAHSYQMRWPDRLFRMVLRAASPQIVAGMRTALSVGIIMLVFSEQFGSTEGVGYQLLSSERNFEVPQMWAAMILLGLLGYLLNVAFRGFERLVLGWHRGMRETPRGA